MKIRAFTLIELLVVIAIIGILASIVLVALEESRRQARNERVIAQVYEYQKALDLYYSGTSGYPGTNGTRDLRACFGDGIANGTRCMGNLTTPYAPASSGAIESALRQHIGALPRFSQPRGTFSYSSPAYSGCTNFSNPAGFQSTDPGSSCTAHDYSFWYLLEGVNQDCGRGLVANASLSGEYTLCRLMPTR